MIYFVQSMSGGPIKIGYSQDTRTINNRLASLQTNSPTELMLVGIIEGNKQTEASLHSQFDCVRVRGEWFDPCDAIVTFIERACYMDSGAFSVYFGRVVTYITAMRISWPMYDIEGVYIAAVDN